MYIATVYMRWPQTHNKQSIKNWHVPITKNWRTVCFTVRGSNVFKIRSLPRIPPSPSCWRITEIPCYQYSQGTICIQKITNWSCICSCCISANYGQYTARSTRSMYRPTVDDILVTGKTADEHIKNLNAVLARLRKAGMRLKQAKYQFSLWNIQYVPWSCD